MTLRLSLAVGTEPSPGSLITATYTGVGTIASYNWQYSDRAVGPWVNTGVSLSAFAVTNVWAGLFIRLVITTSGGPPTVESGNVIGPVVPTDFAAFARPGIVPNTPYLNGDARIEGGFVIANGRSVVWTGLFGAAQGIGNALNSRFNRLSALVPITGQGDDYGILGGTLTTTEDYGLIANPHVASDNYLLITSGAI